MTKSDAITEKKLVEEQLKQEEKKEAAEHKKEEAKAAEVKADAKPAAKAASTAAKPAAKPAAAKEEKKREIVLERVALIPLRSVFAQERSDRKLAAAVAVRAYAARHFKVTLGNVKITPELAATALGNGALRTARAVKARISKDKQGVVLVELVKP